MAIRDERLYRETHDTFESYLDERWQMSRSRGYRLIDGAQVAALVSPTGDIANEAQARELVRVLRDAGEDVMLEVCREAQADAAENGVVLTAAVFRNAARKHIAYARRKIIAKENRARADELSREAGARAPVIEQPILHCSCIELIQHIEPGSVPLIFCDPPYPRTEIEAWSEVPELAMHALTPGGIVAAYSGHFALDEVFDRLRAGGLKYLHTGCIVQSGASEAIKERRVQVGWKPVLFFGKTTDKNVLEYPWFYDTVDSRNRTSDEIYRVEDEWQQNLDVALKWVEKLSRPGQLVVDPFLGSGTFAVAAKELGRRFIGCDIDVANVITAREKYEAAVPV
jgi:16S rRNA G966 N2-methylase RsmD